MMVPERLKRSHPPFSIRASGSAKGALILGKNALLYFFVGQGRKKMDGEDNVCVCGFPSNWVTERVSKILLNECLLAIRAFGRSLLGVS